MSSRSYWLLFGFLFLLACTKHFLTFSLGPGPLVYDANGYWQAGGETAAGDWFQLGNQVDYRPPLYPMLLGVFRCAFGTHALLAVVVFQHLLLLCTELLVACICGHVSGNRNVALVAYALCVACLFQSWSANSILPEPLFAFFLTSTMEFAWPAVKRSVNFWRTGADDLLLYDGPPEYQGQRASRYQGVARAYQWVLDRSAAHALRWNELVMLVLSTGTVLMVCWQRTRPLGLSLAAMFLYFAVVTAAVEVESYRYRMVLEPCMIIAVICGFFAGRCPHPGDYRAGLC